jgi:hypothetical protein
MLAARPIRAVGSLILGFALEWLVPPADALAGDGPVGSDGGNLGAWVLDLGSPDYRRRVAATRHLQNTAQLQVVTAVLESAPWSDPEVVARGLRILKQHADSDDDALRLHAQAALETLTHSSDARLALRARRILGDARRGVLALIEQAGGDVEFADAKTERISGVRLRCPGAAGLLRRLRRLDGLVRLNLDSCELTDDRLDRVADLESLESLSLQSNPLTDGALDWLAKLQRLDALYLSGTRITDEGVARLEGLSKLRVLWLNDTGITDASVPMLAKLPALKHLRVTGTRISDAGLQQLQQALPDTKITR